jgi:hypothetical protein
MDPKPTAIADIISDSIDANMKTEAGFLACAEQARTAIQGFNNLLGMTDPPASELVIKGGMDHIMKTIVRLVLLSFVP